MGFECDVFFTLKENVICNFIFKLSCCKVLLTFYLLFSVSPAYTPGSSFCLSIRLGCPQWQGCFICEIVLRRQTEFQNSSHNKASRWYKELRAKGAGRKGRQWTTMYRAIKQKLRAKIYFPELRFLGANHQFGRRSPGCLVQSSEELMS